MKHIENKKEVFSWALYDWANSAFATTVMAGFFPVFYKQYWAAGVASTESTFQLGIGNAISSLVIVIIAPLIGAIADVGQFKKIFLVVFSSLGITGTACLFWVGQNEWAAAVALYCAATIGFMGANVFYDALILSVSTESNRDLVSALGFALGYLGGGLLFSVNVAMTLSPESFGLDSAADAVRLSFLSVAVWWLLFSIPLLLFVRDKNSRPPVPFFTAIKLGVRQIVTTFAHIRALKPVLFFLIAYWLYIDGVDTVVRMAVDFGLSIGFQQQDLIIALLMTQFIGFPAAIAFGYLGQRIGAKKGIYIGLLVYSLVTVWAFFMNVVWEFYVLAAIIGLVQGGVQSLSRSLYADLIPPARSAEFFGFYNMMGKSAALLGPLLIAVTVMVMQDHRLAMLSLLVFFVGGALFLAKAPHE
ncbi:MAG: MFS transporter [Gammaproteobacteria bacterium SG8_15]|nr:MAG: MFS transporter [Gammaproteobacteria bacterium SG8_15]